MILLATVIVMGSQGAETDSRIRELEIKVKKLEEQPKQIKIESINNEADTDSTTAQQPTRPDAVRGTRPAIFSGGEIESYILAKFGTNGQVALAVAKAESGLNPNAVNLNDARYTGCPSYGVFQINRCDTNLYNWQYNVDVAFEMFTRRGWQPWTVYKTGAYLQYL